MSEMASDGGDPFTISSGSYESPHVPTLLGLFPFSERSGPLVWADARSTLTPVSIVFSKM